MRKYRIRPILATACLLSLCHLQAQTPRARPLYPQGAPDSNGLPPENVRTTQDIVLGATEADYLAYPADADRATGQAVVICPGGGYAAVCFDHEGIQVARWLNERGITAVVLRYRMPNGHPDIPVEDALAAIRMVREKARLWHVDPHRVGIMGFSAGGHLASTVSTHFENDSQRPDFSILIYPVITMDERYTHKVSREELIGRDAPIELVDRYSNEKQVSDRTPVTFLALSDDDGGVPPVNSTMYYEALKAHGVPAELHVYPSGGHGWGWLETFKYHDELRTSLDRWLKEIRK